MSSNIPDFKRPEFNFERYQEFKIKVSQLAPMDMAFGHMAVNEYELLVMTIYRLNDLIDVTNGYSGLIDEILEWILGQGLSEAVLEQLNVWLNDGTLEQLINQTLFNTKLDKITFEEFKVQYEAYKTSQNTINTSVNDFLNTLSANKLDKTVYDANKVITDDAIEALKNSTNASLATKLDKTEFNTFKSSNTIELNKKALKKTPTFTFIFDSAFEDHTTSIADIFKGRKLQCGFAIALQEMKAVRQNIERSTFINPYLELKNRYGFSLLPVSLRHGVLSSPNEIERAYNEIIGAKNAWQDLGVEIAGWVSPSSAIHADYSSMLDIYSYAFNVYEGAVDRNKKQYFTPNDDTHKLSRIHLNNTLGDIKYVIDQTIENNGFLCFYGHTSLTSASKDFELSRITEVLNYIASRGVVKAPDQAIAQYFGSKGYVTSKQKPNKNFIDLSKANSVASNQFDYLYIEPEFSVVGNALELNIEGSVVVGKNYRIIYNLPQGVLSPSDFSSQIYASVKAYDNAITNTRANINILTISPDNERDVVTSSLWREPNTYESISYPLNDNVFTSSTPFKVQIDITFTGGRVGAKFTLKDLFVGITGN